MASTLQSLIDELEDFQDSYTEYDGAIDEGDIEALDIHETIGAQLEQIAGSIEVLKRADSVAREEIEEIEDLLAEVGDAFAELAASV